MPEIVLLGDSIFDNGSYVPGELAVIDQVRERLPTGWNATLLALDGHRAGDVEKQLSGLPATATHLFVSVGGNDGLAEIGMLDQPARTIGDALTHVYAVRAKFQKRYAAMLESVLATGKSVAVCTVYDSVPRLDDQANAALIAFNEVILREAFTARLPVIDLRLLCTSPADYSHISPIEPSAAGGSKIAEQIVRVAKMHDFKQRNSVVYY